MSEELASSDLTLTAQAGKQALSIEAAGKASALNKILNKKELPLPQTGGTKELAQCLMGRKSQMSCWLPAWSVCQLSSPLLEPCQSDEP